MKNLNLKKVFSNLFKKSSLPLRDDQGWTLLGGSVIPSSWSQGWWQQGMRADDVKGNTAVASCVDLYARTIGMLPVAHFKKLPDGSKIEITNSVAAKILRKPNGYQTRADFFMNLIAQEMFTGNGYAIATRDSNFDITSLQLVPPNSTNHYVDPVDKEIYYHVSGSNMTDDSSFMAPQRDVLHIKMRTSESDPLQGLTPLQSGVFAAAAGDAIQRHNAAFFNNMARPSGTLNTDLQLTAAQVKELRDRFNDKSQGINSGQVPVLSSGLKFEPLSITATDAEMIKFYQMTIGDIARVYGIPQMLIGLMENSTLNNAETLINMWISLALGYVVDHVELALNDIFQLPVDEFINFDLDYMLRGDLESRMKAYQAGIGSGVYSINEFRAKEGLSMQEGGDSIRIQMQNVPLTYYQDKLEQEDRKIDIEQQKVDITKDSSEKSSDSSDDPGDSNTGVEELMLSLGTHRKNNVLDSIDVTDIIKKAMETED